MNVKSPISHGTTNPAFSCNYFMKINDEKMEIHKSAKSVVLQRQNIYKRKWLLILSQKIWNDDEKKVNKLQHGITCHLMKFCGENVRRKSNTIMILSFNFSPEEMREYFDSIKKCFLSCVLEIVILRLRLKKL